MTSETKSFDCVEMKNRIQAQRLAEYEARKSEFSSYIDFVNASVKDSQLAQMVRQKAGSAPAKRDG